MCRSMAMAMTKMSCKSSKWFYLGFKQILKGSCKSRTWGGTGRYNAVCRTANTTLRNRTRIVVFAVVVGNRRKHSALRTRSPTPPPGANQIAPSKSSGGLLILVLMLMRLRLLLLLSAHGRRNISNSSHCLINQEISRHHMGLLL
jgi:hypothetical protein